MVYGGGLILGIIAFCTFCTMLYGSAFIVVVILPDILWYRLFKKHVPWHNMPWPGINDGKPLAPFKHVSKGPVPPLDEATPAQRLRAEGKDWL